MPPSCLPVEQSAIGEPFLPRPLSRTLAELRKNASPGRNVLLDRVLQPFRGIVPLNATRGAVVQKLREALPEVVLRLRDLGSNYLINFPEGFSKSSANFDAMFGADLPAKMDRGAPETSSDQPTDLRWTRLQAFTAFACRSLKQAEEKVQEYRNRTGGHAVVVKPFRRVYEDCCGAVGLVPIPSAEFRTADPHRILEEIQQKQPNVWALLEGARQVFNTPTAPFNAAQTVLFVTHPMARHWQHSHITRVWLHPDYHPKLDASEIKRLRSEFTISEVVYDELESDQFVTVLSEQQFDFVRREQERHGAWRNLRGQYDSISFQVS